MKEKSDWRAGRARRPQRARRRNPGHRRGRCSSQRRSCGDRLRSADPVGEVDLTLGRGPVGLADDLVTEDDPHLTLGRLAGYRLEPGAPRPKIGSRGHVLAQADQLIARGRPLPAYDLTRRWLGEYPDDAELVLCNARALRRCGALHQALRALEGLANRPDDDGECRGLAAAVQCAAEILTGNHERALDGCRPLRSGLRRIGHHHGADERRVLARWVVPRAS